MTVYTSWFGRRQTMEIDVQVEFDGCNSGVCSSNSGLGADYHYQSVVIIIQERHTWSLSSSRHQPRYMYACRSAVMCRYSICGFSLIVRMYRYVSLWRPGWDCRRGVGKWTLPSWEHQADLQDTLWLFETNSQAKHGLAQLLKVLLSNEPTCFPSPKKLGTISSAHLLWLGLHVLYHEWKKVDHQHQVFVITSSNIGWFSKLFHWHTRWEIYNSAIKYLTTP